MLSSMRNLELAVVQIGSDNKPLPFGAEKKVTINKTFKIDSKNVSALLSSANGGLSSSVYEMIMEKGYYNKFQVKFCRQHF